MTISFALDDELRDMADMVRKLALEEIRPRLRDFERAGTLPDELSEKLHGLGLTTLPLPEAQGGPGLHLRAACVLTEELAFGDVGAAVAVPGARNAGAAVALMGSEAQKERLLRPFARDDAFARRGALALVEGPFGLTPDGVSTTAERKGDRFVLRGEKRYVLFGDRAELTVVLARDLSLSHEDPWHNLALFAIEGRPGGLRSSERSRTLGLNTASYANLKLDSVEVNAGNRLEGSRDARRDLLELVARKKVLDAARLTGCARAASEYAFKYSTERRAFGKALYEHQGLAFMMADMATRVDGIRNLVWHAAWRLDVAREKEGDGRAAALDPALHAARVAFRQASELAVMVTSDAVQILGGHGYIQDHPVEKWMRDARCLGLVDGLSTDDDAEIAQTVVEAASS